MRSEELELEMVGNQQAWAECDRADRMLRILGRMAGTPGWPTRQQVVLLACDCAETVSDFIPEGEHRPKEAIATARAWANGEDISPAQVRAAADAAAAYAVSSAYTDATYAAYAAYAAASYAADADDDAAADVASYAAAADAAAAYDAAYADYPSDDYAAALAVDARTQKLHELADLIRPRFKPVVNTLGWIDN